ncbi:MAG: DUF1638 domain-containing protein [Desulfobaccales bacterium]|jgi:hypothetical protein
MSLGVICCRVLEREVRAVIRDVPAVTNLEVMEWGLHTRPELLLETLTERMRSLQDHVDAIMLGYGRCLALDRLPDDFQVPVFYPQGDDCIGVLLGQERYAQALQEEAGTWFLTPGWTEMGMEFIFHELQVNRLAEKGIDPLRVAHRMLKDYTRALFIDMNLGDQELLLKKAQEISEEFHLRLERTEGSLAGLKATLSQALQALRLKS